MFEEKFMCQAIKLALRGRGRTSPNPVVGAVIVNDAGEIVGQGYHQEAGGPHAEINALNQAGDKARGATLYVNLEPCCHFGRTPPCTEAIIARGIKKVVAAHADPNPRISGQGFLRLKQAGLEVEAGLLEAKARAINEVFIKYIITGLPFVSLKTAVTLDGKTAVKTGESRWITGVKARKYVHWLRDGVDALLTGIGTVKQDDPLLTTRLKRGGKNPVRVVVDSNGSIDPEARLLKAAGAPTIIAVTEKVPPGKLKRLRDKGAEVLMLNSKDGRVDLRGLMEALGKRQITSIM
ncbi:MAG TPA: bifunctional diaminohydroxyphosphoribosylaminopyrimidine deaminase/5-amino-6-(5-phosphoribosylamino)uracil reductase RibD, partial [Firmicutes bacterium]|nr:bifunctional diaminohydroxyphosphoribosylaminopyrimidine deaminase/5-amino-6-(5-phosphoribosylamino)uracil reductase RibD [Bacillota bacterium]